MLNFAGGGTVINVAAIFIGGVIGLCGGKFLNARIQQTLQMSCATAVIFTGIQGTPENYNTLLLIVRNCGHLLPLNESREFVFEEVLKFLKC